MSKEYESFFQSNDEFLNFNNISREESKISFDFCLKNELNNDISNKKTEYITNIKEETNSKNDINKYEINDDLISYSKFYNDKILIINEDSNNNSDNNIIQLNENNNNLLLSKNENNNNLLLSNNENNNKKNNNNTFKITSKDKEERLDYLIKKFKTLVSEVLHVKLNKIKKFKFYKMDSKKFTSVTSYKKNKIWFDRPISELLLKFNEKNEKNINKLIESKHEKYNEIKKILNSTYEEFIFNNYQELNKEFQKFFNENFKKSIMLRDYNSIQSIIKKIKNKM